MSGWTSEQVVHVYLRTCGHLRGCDGGADSSQKRCVALWHYDEGACTDDTNVISYLAPRCQLGLAVEPELPLWASLNYITAVRCRDLPMGTVRRELYSRMLVVWGYSLLGIREDKKPGLVSQGMIVGGR